TIDWITQGENPVIPILMYELKLYKKGGFAPIVKQCVNCQRTDQLVAFSIAEGGVLCSFCNTIDEQSINIPDTVIKLFNLFENVGLERVGSISIKQENQKLLRQLLDSYYDRYGGYSLKSRRFLQQIDHFI